ncbi:hypothetical protein [Coleofasciculus sp.]
MRQLHLYNLIISLIVRSHSISPPLTLWIEPKNRQLKEERYAIAPPVS